MHMKAALPLLLAACAGGEPAGTSSEPIINGDFDYDADPAVVLVNIQNHNDVNLGSCTGTFITRRVVLTAGHCLEGADHFNIWRANTYDQASEQFTGLVEAQPYVSVKSAASPDFDIRQFMQGTVTGDVGLILVNRPLAADASPMPLSPYRLLGSDVGKAIRFIGFGIRDANTTSTVLEKLDATTQVGTINPQTIEWGGMFNVCSGDSGGPSLINFFGIDYVVSDTSGHSGVCGLNSIMQRTDIYRTFIQQFIAANDPQGTANCGQDGICGTGCSAPDPDCLCAADGMCTTACTDPDHDPDCPMNCGADGQCQRSGCPVPDPDCGTKQTGDTCSSNNECVSGFCVSTKCVATCDSSGGCPSGFTCTKPSNVCLQGDSGGGGCGVAPGRAPGGWLALALAALAARSLGRRRWRARS
jgi:hypothetical protein